MGFRVYGLKTSDDMVGDSQHEVLCTMATLQEGGRTLRTARRTAFYPNPILHPKPKHLT